MYYRSKQASKGDFSAGHTAVMASPYILLTLELELAYSYSLEKNTNCLLARHSIAQHSIARSYGHCGNN